MCGVFTKPMRERFLILVVGVCLSAGCAFAGSVPSERKTPAPLLLDGGRRLEYVRSFSSEAEVKTKKSWLTKVIDFVAGAPEIHTMVRPYDVATDAMGRIIVTDPGARWVHIFDFKKQKYHHLEGSGKQPFESPIGVVVDGQGNIYVSDSELGKIFVFDARGKFRRYIGDVKGEGYFKRPTGLAIDTAANRLYVTDTLKNAVYILDLNGKFISQFGQRGRGDGEFSFPTEIIALKDELAVVDAMNFRVQLFDRNGKFHAKFGQAGDSTGAMFRSKGIAVDSEGDYYVADGYFDCVQVFNRAGALLYFFGQSGSGAMQFQAPAGIHIDPDNTLYVVDSSNHRVQEFRYVAGQATTNSGGVQ